MVVGEIEHTRRITSHVLDRKRKKKKKQEKTRIIRANFVVVAKFSPRRSVGSIDFPGKYSELIMKQIFFNYKIASKTRRARLNINNKKEKKRGGGERRVPSGAFPSESKRNVGEGEGVCVQYHDKMANG